MDYSFAQACARIAPEVREVVVMYDVMCQWHKHLNERIQASPSLRRCFQLHPDFSIVKGIGLFHVHGHQEQCFARYAPDFIPGIGQTEGEIIETLWSIINDVSRGCRGMTAAHRQEMLDDHMNDSNWMKMIRMSMFSEKLLALKFTRLQPQGYKKSTQAQSLRPSPMMQSLKNWTYRLTRSIEPSGYRWKLPHWAGGMTTLLPWIFILYIKKKVTLLPLQRVVSCTKHLALKRPVERKDSFV